MARTPKVMYGNFRGKVQYYAKCNCDKDYYGLNEKDVKKGIKSCMRSHSKAQKYWASGGKKVVKTATWNARRRKGECACGCGKPAKPGELFRAGCSRKVILQGTDEYRDLEARVRKGVTKIIPPGQNPNGLVYDIDGNRVFPFEYE